MSTTDIWAWGYSDDILRIKIDVDGKNIYDDEVSPGIYRVNDLFSIYGSTDDTPGWMLGITEVQEEGADWSDKYRIFLSAQSENPYSPMLHIQTEETVVLEGIYGDLQTEFIAAIDQFIDRDEALRIFKELKKKGFLKDT